MSLRGDKKIKIINLLHDYRPAVIAMKVGCRREYVYMIIKRLGLNVSELRNKV